MKQAKSQSSSRNVARNRVAGFWAAALVNIFLLLWTLLYPQLFEFIGFSPTATSQVVTGLPWLLNGFLVFGSLVVNPQFTIGYMVSLAFVGSAALLYLPSCLATCLTMSIVVEGAADLNAPRLGMNWPDNLDTLEGFLICFTALYVVFWLAGGLLWSRRMLKGSKPKLRNTLRHG